MLLAQFSLTWESIYHREGSKEPNGLIETTHEARETNERCISIIRDGPRDGNRYKTRKGKKRKQHGKRKSRDRMQDLLPQLDNRLVSQGVRFFGLDEGIHSGRVIVHSHLAIGF